MEPLNLWRSKGPLSVEEPGKKYKIKVCGEKKALQSILRAVDLSLVEDGF